VQTEDPSRQVQYAANKESLDSTNFIWDHNQHRFDSYIKPAVGWFKASKGHAKVPTKLVLDKAQCREAGLPKHVKEFRLGSTVNRIRSMGIFVQTEDPSRQAQYTENKETLDSTSFIWDPYQHRFDCYIQPAVSWFKASDGHAQVPTTSVLDEAQCREAGMPKHVKEFRLRQVIDTTRSQGVFVQTEDPSREAQYAANKEKLDTTNFIWDPYQHRFDCYIKPAVSWFKASKGHAKVPTKLVLDELQCRKAGLPEHVTEFRLGQTVNAIRSKGVFVQTEDPSREAQYAANKDWLEAHLDKTWLWTKLS
jgi:hypothetical protein